MRYRKSFPMTQRSCTLRSLVSDEHYRRWEAGRGLKIVVVKARDKTPTENLADLEDVRRASRLGLDPLLNDPRTKLRRSQKRSKEGWDLLSWLIENGGVNVEASGTVP